MKYCVSDESHKGAMATGLALALLSIAAEDLAEVQADGLMQYLVEYGTIFTYFGVGFVSFAIALATLRERSPLIDRPLTNRFMSSRVAVIMERVIETTGVIILLVAGPMILLGLIVDALVRIIGAFT